MRLTAPPLRFASLTFVIGIAAAFAPLTSAFAAQWMDVATISNTMGNNAGRLCVGGGRTDVGCPGDAPLLDSARGLLTVPTDLRVTGNLYVSGSQQFDGVTFSNGGISATGVVTATTFHGSGEGLSNIPASAVVGLSFDRIVSSSANVIVGSDGFIRLSTGSVSNTAYFDTAGRLINPGVSATGTISASRLYSSGDIYSDADIHAGNRFWGNELWLGNDGPIHWSNSTGIVGSGITNQIDLFTNSAYAMSIVSSGNVGIGGDFHSGNGPTTALQVSGTLRISNGGEACDTNRIGAIRYTTGKFYVCQSTSNGWEALATATSTTTLSINTGVSGSLVYRNEFGILIASDTLSISSTTGSVGIGAGAPASVGNNGLYVAGAATFGGLTSSAGNFIFNTVSARYLSWNGTGGAYLLGDPTAKSLVLGTNGADAMRIVSTGLVGIGTTTPSSKLDVNGTGTFTGVVINKDTPGLTFNYTNSTTSYGAIDFGSNGVQQWEIGATPLLYNDDPSIRGGFYIGQYKDNSGADVNRYAFTASGDTGNVGIRLSSASTALEVGGTLKIANGGEACDTPRIGAIRYTGGAFFVCQNTTNGWEALATTGANSLADRITSSSQAGVIANSNGYISLTTGGVTGTVYFTPAGKLVNSGVSTTGPISGTSVYAGNYGKSGSIVYRNASGVLTGSTGLIYNTSGTVEVGTGAPSWLVNGVWSEGYFATNTFFNLQNYSGAESGLLWGSGEVAIYGNLGGTDRYMRFATGSTERMRIVSTGLVGIGTSSPTTKLDVSGTLKIANGNEACSASTLGAIRYSGGQFYVCRTAGTWETLVAGSSGSVQTDRITSGTTSVVVNQAGNSISFTTNNTLRAAFDATGRLNLDYSLLLDQGAGPMDNLIYVGSNTSGPVNASFGFMVGGTGSGSAADGPYYLARGNNFSNIANQRGMMYFAAGNVSSPVGNDGAMIFATGPSEARRMAIEYSGSVNIGGTAPAAALLDVSGTIRMSNGGESCTAATLGAMKYAANQFYVCRNGTSWETLAASGASSGYTDRIISGTAGVFANQNGSSVSITTSGIDRVFVNSAGFVGINQPASNGIYLAVSGTTSIVGRLGLLTPGSTQNVIVGSFAGASLTGTGNATFGYYSMNAATGSNSAAFGNSAAQNNTGSNITAMGTYAAQNNGGAALTAIGYVAGLANSGTNVVAVGNVAGQNNTGNYATVVGNAAGQNNSAANLTAVGASAAQSNTGIGVSVLGYTAGQYNTGANVTAMGLSVAYNNSGANLTAIGSNAAYNNTGGNNTAIGTNSLLNHTSGANNTAVGMNAGIGSAGTNTFAGGTLFGAYAGQALTSGNSNTLIGYNAGGGITSGANNIVIGADTSPLSNTGSYQLNIGNALWGDLTSGIANANKFGINVAAPATALDISGTLKIANGNEACSASTLGAIRYSGGAFWVCQNAGSGWEAIGTTGANSLNDRITSGTTQMIVYQNTSATIATAGVQRVVVGTTGEVGIAQQPVSGYSLAISGTSSITGRLDLATATGYNVLVGTQAGLLNTGTGLTAVGYNSAQNNTGINVTSIGYLAGQYATGTANTFVGSAAGMYNTGGSNAVLGSRAMRFNSTGTDNIVIGFAAGQGTPSTSLYTRSTLIGSWSGWQLTSGIANNAIGYNSGYNLTTGSSNTLVGDQSGYGLTTGSNNLAIGAGTNLFSNTGNNQLNIANAIWGNIGSGTSNANLIGINVTSPTANLEVSGTTSATTVATPLLQLRGVAGGSGVSLSVQTSFALDDLTDVTVATPVSGSILMYNSTTSQWENKPYSALTGLVNNDRIVSGTFASIANSTGYVSLTTAGTTWGYLGNAGSFLPQIMANFTSSTSISSSIIATTRTTSTYVSSTKVDVSGTLRIADGGETCSAATLGAIKYLSGQFYVCRNGASWETLVAGSSGSVSTDRITSGTTSMITYNNTSATITTAGVERVIVGTNGNIGIAQQPETGYVAAISGTTKIRGRLELDNGVGTGLVFVGSSNGTTNSGGWEVIGMGNGNAQNNTGTSVIAIGSLNASVNTGSNVVALGRNSALMNTGNRIIAIGDNGAAQMNTGSDVIAFGNAAGMNSGAQAIAIGDGALNSNYGSSNFVGIGQNALYNNSGATDVVGIGQDAANANGGSDVIALGRQSAYGNTATDVVSIGNNTGYQNSGIGLIAIGKEAANGNTADQVIALGTNSSQANQGTNAITIGQETGYGNLGTHLIAMGFGSARDNTGNDVVAIGHDAADSNTGNYTVAIGTHAGFHNQRDYTVSIGYKALELNASGSANVAVGSNALAVNTNGSANTALGTSAGINATGVSGSTFIGAYAGQLISTGSSNTLIGYNAGSGLTTGANNLSIGAGTTPFAAGGNNQLNIANAIWGDYGRPLASKIGINVTSPTANFEVSGTVSVTSLYVNGQPVGASSADRIVSGSTSVIAQQSSGTIAISASGILMDNGGTAETHIELGEHTPTNRYAYIDLTGDPTYSDYGLRIIRNNTGANASSFIQHRGTGDFALITSEAASIVFQTSSTERMRIDPTGNIGINNSAPETTQGKVIHLYNNANTGTAASNATYIAESANRNVSYQGRVSSSGVVSLQAMNWGSGLSYGQVSAWANGNNPYMAFYVSGTTSSPLERMRITDTGLVGIGTNAPTTNLDVSGTLRIRDGYQSCATATLGAIRYDGANFYVCRNTVNGWETMGTSSGGAVTDRIISGTTGVFTYNNSRTTIVTNNIERVVVNTAGEVGIGQQPASTYALSIQGRMGLETATNSNMLIGTSAGYFLTTGANNVGLGKNVLQYSGASNYATAVGNLAGGGSNGDYVTAIGYNSANLNAASYVTAVGSGAARTNKGGFVVAIGSSAAENNQASGTVAIGYIALQGNSTGLGNTGVGYQSIQNNNTGSYNTALGYNAGKGTGTNAYSANTAIGAQAGTGLTTGNSNTLIGYNVGAGLTTGSNNLLIGQNLSPFSNTGDNQLNIGNAIWGNIGSGTANANFIGINVTSPTAALEVSGTVSTTFIQLQALTGSAGVSMTVSSTADNLGNHTATQALNMATFNITGAGIVSATGNIKTTSALQAGNIDTVCSTTADYGKMRFDVVTKRMFLCRP